MKKEEECTYDLFSPLSSLSEWQVPTEPESSVEVSPQWNPTNLSSLFHQAMTTDVYSMEGLESPRLLKDESVGKTTVDKWEQWSSHAEKEFKIVGECLETAGSDQFHPDVFSRFNDSQTIHPDSDLKIMKREGWS